MKKFQVVPEKTKEPAINLALDTLSKNKQGFVFVNTKRSAERTAEDISKKVSESPKELEELAQKARTVLSKPTHQCERLYQCLKKGIAFHHAGLHAKQKELIEENFRKGRIKIICCTPTLSQGLDLPAFRAIIRDVKRFTQAGMAYIPVLEYQQMCLPYDTLVFTDKGEIKIGEMVEKQMKCKVLSLNTETNNIEFKPIIKHYASKTRELVQLTTDKGYHLKITANHPVWANGKFIPAAKAKTDDCVLFFTNNHLSKKPPFLFQSLPQELLRVRETRRIKLKKPINVYNIQVKDNENYFANNFLVHNCGRAGRPKFGDKYGEAIVIANSEAEKEVLKEKYLRGLPENIYSKLAVEPVLRTYVLSLIASRIVRTKQQILDFFSQTFWAYQYKDLKKLSRILTKTVKQLLEWNFIDQTNDSFRATILGKRVAELYLDPLTAHKLVTALHRALTTTKKPVSWLHLIASTLEMRPYLKVRTKEFSDVQEKLAKVEHNLLEKEPSPFEPEYEDWLNSFKTALMLQDWIEEKDDEYLLDHYNIRPGETRTKLSVADWLCYSLGELARIEGLHELIKETNKIRFRLKYGVKEELLPLLKLEGIGRVRARELFRAGIKDIGDVRRAKLDKLTQVLGARLAAKVKKQIGE